jgi:hypothetical protein
MNTVRIVNEAQHSHVRLTYQSFLSRCVETHHPLRDATAYAGMAEWALSEITYPNKPTDVARVIA